MRPVVLLVLSTLVRTLRHRCRSRHAHRRSQPVPHPRSCLNPVQSTPRRPSSFILKAPSPSVFVSRPPVLFKSWVSPATSATVSETPPFELYRRLASNLPPTHPVIRPIGKALSTSPFNSPGKNNFCPLAVA